MLIGREKELKSLQEYTNKTNGTIKVMYIYGAKGVGVSSVLRGFAARLARNDEYTVLYIDSIEGDDVARAVVATDRIKGLVLSMASSTEMEPGRALLYTLPIIAIRLGLPNIRDKRAVIIVDHIDKGIGPTRTPEYLDSLKASARKLIQWRARGVTIIAGGTQLGLQEIENKGHVLGIAMDFARIVGLEKEPYYKLLESLQVNFSLTPSELWELTGGNPGETLVLAKRYRGDHLFWLSALKARLRRVIRIIENKGLLEELRNALDDLGNIHPRVAEILQAYDIVIRCDKSVLGKEDEYDECGLEWQLPVYKKLLTELLSV
ncbi:hypothetical protein PYJP_19050 [Pyrofollis japonicus]|uniref:ATP-binding protein n=1 Tax=Pyrofollis japonicus TaxID=3060460 RepID=UPI00295AB476|nr:ATP-binding protein [Pyrofollis japonicus]BEP18553.1 hypothetical protein PYJP_19050 [Pyrofollis japonicus]